MLQLYALRSARSWGIGDLGDLREFVNWAAREHGAGAVLLNPLHAPGPTHPVQPSPYTPSSRRFANPLALRIEDLDAYRRADPVTRAEVEALRVSPTTTRIDHDLVWAAKRDALEILWRAEGRPNPFDDPSVSQGLAEWAAYCAMAERQGRRWWRRHGRWPSGTAAYGRAGRNRCATWLAPLSRPRAGNWRRGWHFTPGCNSNSPSNSREFGRPRTRRGCRSAYCTTSRWASTRTVPTRGRWPTCSHPASVSARRRTTSPRAARTGGFRRDAPTRWQPPGTPPC